MTLEDYAVPIRDWMVAPLAWQVEPDTQDWLLPERQARGLHVPATWLFPGAPTIHTEPAQIRVTLGGRQTAYYHYWNDELRERHYLGAGPRVGGELLVRREWLEPQIAAGATLCWVVTLSIAQREEYKEKFGDRQVIGTWVIGGSHILRPEPWRPPSPG